MLEFSEERILVLGSTNGIFDLVQIVIGDFLNVHGLIVVDGKDKVLIECFSELLSLLENSFGRGGLEIWDWHWQS